MRLGSRAVCQNPRAPSVREFLRAITHRAEFLRELVDLSAGAVLMSVTAIKNPVVLDILILEGMLGLKSHAKKFKVLSKKVNFTLTNPSLLLYFWQQTKAQHKLTKVILK